jgi:hypothetical protein
VQACRPGGSEPGFLLVRPRRAVAPVLDNSSPATRGDVQPLLVDHLRPLLLWPASPMRRRPQSARPSGNRIITCSNSLGKP